MKTKKIHHYMNKTIHVSAIVLAILILTVGCQGKKGGSRAEDEGSNTVLADSTIQKYSGKATVTGSEYLDKLSEICRYSVDSLDGGGCSLDLDILESRFADEIFLDLDEDVRKDDFALSVKDWFDRTAFLYYCSSLYELRVRYDRNNYSFDTTAVETPGSTMLTGEMRPSMSVLQKVFPDKCVRDAASALLNMLYKTPDFNDVSKHLGELVDAYESAAFASGMPIDTAKIGKAFANEDAYYDKSAFVPDIKRFRDARAYFDSAAVQIKDPVGEIEARMKAPMDFDTKCVYAIELSHVQPVDCVDTLGALIESRIYSRYLLEVWENWRAEAQFGWFGCSNDSEIPNAYYLKIRNICANTMIRHIQKHPEDNDAYLRLFRLLYCEPIHRGGGLFGNEVVAILCHLRSAEY